LKKHDKRSVIAVAVICTVVLGRAIGVSVVTKPEGESCFLDDNQTEVC